MKENLLLLACLFATPLAFANPCGTKEANWLLCERAEQCDLVRNECGGSIAVNKANLAKAKQYFTCMAPRVNCAFSGKQEGKKIAVTDCIAGECVLKSTKSTEAEKSSEETACEKAGGRWMGSTVGRGQLTGCNLPTKDGGKPCQRGEDCESVCLTDNTCYGWQMYKGCGYFRGHQGAICVD